VNSRRLRPKSQRGMVLILIAFIIGLGAAAFMFKMFNASSLQVEQDKQTMLELNAAKQALIAWAVAHPNSPGMMPWPDRNTDLDFDGDSAYDGKSDCVTTTFQPSYLLGQLPWRAQSNPCVMPHTGLGADFRDAQGNRLWYAVSRNLIRDYQNSEYPIINPGMANPPHAVTPYLRQGGTDSYPWLKVLDRNGNLVSDRVAAVIISPGSPLDGQDRSSLAPDASQYLDTVRIGAATFKNSDAALVDEDFIMGEDSRNVSSNDASLNQPYYFNDKLVYITIDELLAVLEKRVGEVARASLKNYQDANGYYPYAAQLGTTTNFACELTTSAMTTGLMAGVLPVNNQSCAYTRTASATTLSCEESIFDASSSGVTSIRFDRTSGGNIANTDSGLCTRNSSTRCTCTGAGTCGNATSRVLCTSLGCSSTGLRGSYRITNGKFRFRSGGCSQNTFPTKTAASCSNSNSVITCNTSDGDLSSCGDISFKNYLPTWFVTNQWQNYVYYQMTRPASATITLGGRTTESAVVTTGRPIISAPFAYLGGAQLTPSCNDVRNYLDSEENADGDMTLDATSKQRATNYNDQTFVVAP
jgi:hypothetical protein